MPRCLRKTLASGPATRNSLINEPVVTLDDRNPDRTDILHEYFVSPERFADFVTLCRAIIPASYQEFLNVTLRYVDTNPDSWLAYAPVPRIAVVMSFSQEMSVRAEADMTRMTRELIDGVIAIGGTYYLPYRPHARVEQMAQGYARAAEFAAAYFVILLGAAALNYVHGITDAEGPAFGIFALDPFDDALHLVSALWALGAAIFGARASKVFLVIFGALYLGDGVFGFFTDYGYLDFGIFTNPSEGLSFTIFRVLANLPHIALGGIALIAGLRFGRAV